MLWLAPLSPHPHCNSQSNTWRKIKINIHTMDTIMCVLIFETITKYWISDTNLIQNLPTWKPRLSIHQQSFSYKSEEQIHPCRSNFDSKLHCISSKIRQKIICTANRKLINWNFCFRLLPASSPLIRNFGLVSMKCFLHIGPIVIYLSIFFSARVIAWNPPQSLITTHGTFILSMVGRDD